MGDNDALVLLLSNVPTSGRNTILVDFGGCLRLPPGYWLLNGINLRLFCLTDCWLCCEEQEVWQPLVRPAFLEVLWQKLTALWEQLQFVPREGQASGALWQCCQSGQYPSGNAVLGPL